MMLLFLEFINSIWLASLFLMVVGLQLDIIDKKFLFVNIPNEKISLQHGIHAEPKTTWSFKIYKVNVTQSVTFHMIPKFTNVTLGCNICIFDVSITYFTGENLIRIWRNTHLASMLIVFLLYENSYCKLLLCCDEN